MKAGKFINTFIELRGTVESLISQSYDVKMICEILLSKANYIVGQSVAQTDEQLMALCVQICSEYAPYAYIQNILRNDLIIPKNRKQWFLYSPSTNKRTKIDRSYLDLVFANKKDYMRNARYAIVVYEPHNRRALSGETEKLKFNNYQPPFWKEDLILNKVTDVPVVDAPPQIYIDFLNHLTDNDELSVQFTLDWLAISLRERNRTYLCTIGDQGIGKGVLGAIMKELHGRDNYVQLEFNRAMDARFNAAMGEKTLIYLDEVNKVTSAQNDKLKMQSNDEIEIEYKGVDSETQENWANVYISSNHINSLRLEPGDRRHSIINMVKGVRIDHIWSQEQINALVDKDNIEQFARYLWHRKFNRANIATAFKSKVALEIQESTTADWEKWFLDEYCKENSGKTVAYMNVVQDVREKFGAKLNMNRNNIISLSKRFPGVFVLSKSNTYVGSVEANKRLKDARVNCVKILPIDKQLNYDIITEED